MQRIAALGEEVRVQGYALAGAVVIAADGPEAVRSAWRTLPEDIAVVVLTPAAAAALGTDEGMPDWPLWVVLP
jgi:vacuolar-type H+-ATPase subunit F/Vma7